MRILALLTILSILTASSAAPASRLPERARNGMVASVSPIASEVGVQIMKAGGNAVDAAIAVGFVLAVTWPSAGNLGGGGFMLVRLHDGTAEAIDYRERAPLAATRDMYIGADGKVIEGASTEGYLAAAVPGTVAGLWMAHERHGQLPWKMLVEPARRLAIDGFVVDQYLAASLCSERAIERMTPFPESRRIFQRNGDCYVYGDVFRQPELGAVLERIRDNGAEGFYRGRTAELLVADMERHGGIITAEDLRTYEPTLREPLRTDYRGVEVLTMPPPSSGGVALIQMLEMVEPHDLRELGFGSADYIHLLTEVMKRAFADRAQFLADTDFAPDVPIHGLLDPAYIASRARTISMKRATPSLKISAGKPAPPEGRDTTHFSIVDAEGNMVSNTYTINSTYGSAATATGLGFILNNEMDDFTSAPGAPNAYGLLQSENNAIAPRKRPLSAMTPTILIREGRPWAAIGSPGGPTIINTVLQTIIHVVDFEMNIQQAVDAPRFHHQWMPDRLDWEPRGINPDSRRILESRGHTLLEASKLETLGDAEAVMIDSRTGERLGASDPRRGGQTRGY